MTSAVEHTGWMNSTFTLDGLSPPVPAAEPLRPSGQRRHDPARRPTSHMCANCGRAFTPPTRATAFCGLRCKEEARAVRYGRKLRREYGGDLPDDHAYALKMRIAHALGGGYRANARRLNPDRRAEVIARDGGRCVLCASDGEEIDHVQGDSNALSNLRYLCKPCHREVTEKHLAAITDKETLLRDLKLRLRIAAREPLRACDREDWSQIWRTWVAEHATCDT